MNNKDQIKNILTTLTHKRFKTKKDIKDYLQAKLIDYKITLFYNTNDFPTIDYSIIGSIENNDILCDFDIYFAKTRAREMLITEIGYEFQ